ncbi:hypothetical protein TA3x_003239 [Tundrisphaera sp. TA3]|uniref:hypothetical protein n=1 Tax=Tundrisphaera sp. TA3 TaxID=3435775 RepID=UPI003EB83719
MEFEDGPASMASRRVALPIDWPPGVEAKFRLRRRFGRPNLDPARDALRLELDRVPGLISARINEREVELFSREAGSWSAPLDGPLQPRNDLVLVVDLGEIALAAPPGEWGAIALVIQSRDD